MKERLQKKYGLSDEGVNDLIQGIISSAILFISHMLIRPPYILGTEFANTIS